MQISGKLSIADYSYDLPHDRIARYPLENRDESKLLISSSDGAINEDRFYNLHKYLFYLSFFPIFFNLIS